MIFFNSKLTIIILSILLLLPAKPISAQDKKQEMEMMLARSWEIIAQSFSENERNALNNISLSVSPSPNFTIARTSLENKQIEISYGFGMMVWAMSVSSVISYDLKKPNAMEKHAEYMANWAGITKDLKLPWETAQLNQSEIRLLESKSLQQKIGSTMTGVFSFVLLHECGHHVVYYRKGDEYPKNPSNRELRKIERMADLWASMRMVKVGLAPLYAILPNLYFHYRDEYAILKLEKRSHPPELIRIYDIFSYSLGFLDDYYDPDLSYSGVSIDAAQRALKKAIVYTQEKIANSLYYDRPEVYGDVEDISDGIMRKCMSAAYDGCMQSCINKYGHSFEKCRDNMCSSKRQKRISWFRCEESMRY